MYTTITANKVSDINNNGVTYQNQNLEINQPLSVDRNLTFINCRIKFGTNGYLFTTGNVSLRANCSIFTGCGNNWYGIVIKPGARFFFDDCLIREANRGIELERGYQPLVAAPSNYNRIVGCRFEHNVYGIRTGNRIGSSLPVRLSPIVFEGNTFAGKTLAGPNLQPYAGIHLINARGHLGYSGAPNPAVNTFSGLPFGITMSGGSDVRIANCVFKQMQTLPSNYGDAILSSTGVYSADSRLRVSKSLTHRPCTFEATGQNGILSRYARLLEVKENIFTDQSSGTGSGRLDYGIKSEFNTVPVTILLERNDMDFYTRYHKEGISLDRPLASNYNLLYTTIVRHNYIDYWNRVLPDQTGIFIRNKYDAYDRMLVDSNQIAVHSLAVENNGIQLSRLGGVGNVSGSKVFNNQISYTTSTAAPANNDDYNSWGISFEDLINYEVSLQSPYRNEISNNDVKASTFTWNGQTASLNQNIYSALKCGIHVYESPFATVAANFVEKAMRQFHFANNNTACNFLCNDMGEGRFGLHCLYNYAPAVTNMGDQVLKGNVWLSTSTFHQSGALHSDGTPPFKFFVNPNYQGHKPPSWAPIDWFEDDFAEPECGIDPNEINPRYLSWLDTLVLTGADTNSLQSIHWDNKRLLIRKLLEAPAALQEHPDASTWLSNQNGGSAWLYVKAEHALRNAMDLSPAIEDSLRALDLSEKIWSDSLHRLLMALDASPADSTVLHTALDTVYSALEQVLALDDTLRAYIHNERASKLLLAQDTVEMLPDTSAWEWARKQVLLSVVKNYQNVSPTTAELQTLHNIAISCPDSVASALFCARGLLPEDTLVNRLVEGHISSCISLRSTPIPEQTATESRLLQILPNPATDRITVRCSEPIQLLAWEIRDASAKVIQTGHRATLPMEVLLPDGQPGYYYFHGIGPDGTVYHSSFIVSK